MNDKSRTDYNSLLAEAEAAVAAVKDPDLRRVAFEKILDRLLMQGTAETETKERKTSTAMHPDSGVPSRTKRGPLAYLEELIREGFFKQQRTLAHVKAELANRGHHVPRTSLSGPLQALCQNRRLRREKSRIDHDKTTYCYSEW